MLIIMKNNYRVGIYTRLSIDDGTNEESVSIDTQKKILTDFVDKQGWRKFAKYMLMMAILVVILIDQILKE